MLDYDVDLYIKDSYNVLDYHADLYIKDSYNMLDYDGDLYKRIVGLWCWPVY